MKYMYAIVGALFIVNLAVASSDNVERLFNNVCASGCSEGASNDPNLKICICEQGVNRDGNRLDEHTVLRRAGSINVIGMYNGDIHFICNKPRKWVSTGVIVVGSGIRFNCR